MIRRMGSSLVLDIYTALFLIIIFAPMVMMVIASFNETSPPNVMEWSGTTLKWYRYFWMSDAELAADPVLRAFDRNTFVGCAANSLIVAAGVVPLSLILGLAGAVVLTKLRSRFNGFLSWVLLSPMLMPGITLGLSTMIYWSMVGVMPGLFTATMAMTSFVATVPMLIIMGRLQRQDPSLEEAALDLGASPTYTFWRVTLPFLAPALGVSAVLAFLWTVENYNTTKFSIGTGCTLSTHIGDMVRNPVGHPPLINVVGTVVILLTVAGAILRVLDATQDPAGQTEQLPAEVGS